MISIMGVRLSAVERIEILQLSALVKKWHHGVSKGDQIDGMYKTRHLYALASLFMGMFIVTAVLAEEISASEVRVSTPEYRVDMKEFSPPLGTYTFTVGWQGIPAATVTLSVAQDNGNLRVIAAANTYSGIDILYRLRYRAEALLSGKDLRPLKTVISQQENSKFKTAQISFEPNGVIQSVRATAGKPAEVLNFTSDNFTLDPFAAAFLARASTWTKGQTRQFDTFNGKTRYLISLTAIDKETIDVAGEKRECWVISPKVVNLNKPDTAKKLREAKIYLTNDDRREVVRLESSVFIGSVTTELDSFEPSSPPSIQVASHSDTKRPI